MEYTFFLELLQTELQKQLGEDYEVSVTSVTQNNGICLSGLVVRKKGEHLAPAFYPESQFEDYTNGKGMPTIAGEMIRLAHVDSPQPEIDLHFFTSYNEMRERILFKLIHYHKNSRLLEKIPHIRYLDMAIVFYCDVPVKELQNGTILIHNTHMEKWGATAEDLCKYALKNTPSRLPPVMETMGDVVRGMMSDISAHRAEGRMDEDENRQELMDRMMDIRSEELLREQIMQTRDRYKMYVLSNSKKLFGAAAILYPNVLQRFADRLQTGLYLLPSSVHEIILVPDDGLQDPEELRKIVSEVNDTQVGAEEILAYSVYYFDRGSGNITVLS